MLLKVSEMRLTAEDAREVVYDYHPDWKEVSPRKLEDKSRWELNYSIVCLYVPSGKHYKFWYSVGATELQDRQAYEDVAFVKPVEVKKVTKTIEVWEPV